MSWRSVSSSIYEEGLLIKHRWIFHWFLFSFETNKLPWKNCAYLFAKSEFDLEIANILFPFCFHFNLMLIIFWLSERKCSVGSWRIQWLGFHWRCQKITKRSILRFFLFIFMSFASWFFSLFSSKTIDNGAFFVQVYAFERLNFSFAV